MTLAPTTAGSVVGARRGPCRSRSTGAACAMSSALPCATLAGLVHHARRARRCRRPPADGPRPPQSLRRRGRRWSREALYKLESRHAHVPCQSHHRRHARHRPCAGARALLARGHRVAITGTTRERRRPGGRTRSAEQCGDPGRVLGLVCDVRDRRRRRARRSHRRRALRRARRARQQRRRRRRRSRSPSCRTTSGTASSTPTSPASSTAAARHSAPGARGGGWIVNVSSLASKNPFAGGAAYCASKAGLNAFSEALMQELRHSNIRVSYVLPGRSPRDSRAAGPTAAPMEAEPGRCGAGDRRPAGSPDAQPAEPGGDSALATAEVAGTEALDDLQDLRPRPGTYRRPCWRR